MLPYPPCPASFFVQSLTILQGQLIPERICSLSLFSTLARFQRTVPFLQNLRNRVSMFLPKSLDRTIIDVAYNMFPDSWLDAPDTLHLPSSTTPGCLPAAGHTDWESGAYGHFPTNFARIAAQDLEKRSDTDGFGPKGFILQAIAAGWHDMSPERLKELGDKVGRERILVVHGTEDRMLTFPHGEALIKQLEPGQSYVREGRGHVLLIEEQDWHDETIAKLWAKTALLSV
jgi:hypothetical protein